MATAEQVHRVHLTDEQRQHYADKGFLVVPGVLTPDEVARIKKRAREIACGDLPPGTERLLVWDVHVAKKAANPDDPEMGLWKLLNPHRIDPVFESYPATPALADVVEGLIGPDFKSFLLMFIYKPPGLHSDHPFHQDSFYFPFGPHDLVLGSWVTLDATDKDNGTLAVLPGSHKLDLLPHGMPEGEMVNYGVFGAQGYEGSHPDEVVLNLQPGDGAFFHSRLLHRTGPNVSDRHRRVLTVHFASSKCKFTGQKLKEFDFRPVRGQSYEDCI